MLRLGGNQVTHTYDLNGNVIGTTVTTDTYSGDGLKRSEIKSGGVPTVSGLIPGMTGSVSADIDRCIFLPVELTFTILGGKPFLELEICYEKYNTMCCNPPFANACTDIRVNFGITIAATPFSLNAIKNFEDMHEE